MKTSYMILLFAAFMTGLVFTACSKDDNNTDTGGDPLPSARGFREDGASNALFSVSATKKVHFSRGNLQYHALNHKWRFAEEQYTICGDDNRNISATYNGWIDLFGWGTGNNPTDTSLASSDYSEFHEWGNNPITNGGNQPNMWRTLTEGEWDYLLTSRPNATSKYGIACLDGEDGPKGMVILPDNWVTPSGVPAFVPGITRNTGRWNDNTYTLEEWRLMENAGAIFLPAAGSRKGTVLYSIWTRGNYWSSSMFINHNSSYSNTMLFQESDLLTTEGFEPYKGFSVRLVKE